MFIRNAGILQHYMASQQRRRLGSNVL